MITKLKKNFETLAVEFLNSSFKNSKVTIDIKSQASNTSILEIGADNLQTEKFRLRLEEYPSCCGMREIGQLSNPEVEINLPKDLLINLLSKLIVKTIEKEVEDVINKNKFSDNESHTLGFSVTLPYEEKQYFIWEQAFLKAGFSEVGQFRNANSGNKLKHYIFI